MNDSEKMTMNRWSLRRALYQLAPKPLKDLTVMDVCGARAVFNKKIYRGKSVVDLADIDLHPSPDTDKRVLRILEKWANGKKFIALMSQHLTLHLDLPVRKYPPSHNFFQVLLLGEKLPFLLLTLYDRTSMDKESERSLFEAFAMDCARELTSHLFNFYLKDFILLPCTLERESLCVESLEEEVEVQVDLATDFYGGPLLVAKKNFDVLAQAVSIVATASEVPCFFDGLDDAGKKWILVSDPDSDRALRQLIWYLQAEDSTRDLQPIYLEKTEAAKMVLLEAAKRLSFRQKVVIVSDDQKVQDCVKKLAAFTHEEYGLDPSRFRCLSVKEASSGEMDVQSERGESNGESEACVIAIDVPGYVGHPRLRLRVLEQTWTSAQLGSSAVRVRIERQSRQPTVTTLEDLLDSEEITEKEAEDKSIRQIGQYIVTDNVVSVVERTAAESELKEQFARQGAKTDKEMLSSEASSSRKREAGGSESRLGGPEPVYFSKQTAHDTSDLKQSLVHLLDQVCRREAEWKRMMLQMGNQAIQNETELRHAVEDMLKRTDL